MSLPLGDDDGKHKYNLVKWEDIKMPNCLGRLGIKSMMKMNDALFVKWLWKYMNEDNRLWRRIVELVGVTLI